MLLNHELNCMDKAIYSIVVLYSKLPCKLIQLHHYCFVFSRQCCGLSQKSLLLQPLQETVATITVTNMFLKMLLWRKRQAQQHNAMENKWIGDQLESANSIFFPLYQSERAKWEPRSVLSKLEGGNEQKTGKNEIFQTLLIQFKHSC